METIAVYWEPLIKIYGLDVHQDLCMLSIAADLEHLCAGWPHCFENLGPDSRMVLALARPLETGRLQWHLFFSGTCSAMNRPGAARAIPGADIRVDKPVDLIQFHGPHFGDRYGIAAAALDALEAMQVPVKAVACSSASVYLATAPGSAQAACKALSRAFAVPPSPKKKSFS